MTVTILSCYQEKCAYLKLLIVSSYNINYGKKQPLLDKCRYPKDYSTLVGKIKQGIANGLSLRDSIIQAVNSLSIMM